MAITFDTFPEELARLQTLADRYHLTLHLHNENNALLLAPGFLISVTVDREDARLWYYDAYIPGQLQEYALDYLLFRKRRPSTPSEVHHPQNADRVRADLHETITRLETDASDVLSGQRDWFAEYTWTVSPLIGSYRTALLAALDLARTRSL